MEAQVPVSIVAEDRRVELPSDLASYLLSAYERVSTRHPDLYKNFDEYVIGVIEGGIYNG